MKNKVMPPVATRFKPGQSGNPKGKPPLSPELRAIKELTIDELKRTIAKYARMTKEDLAKAIQDPKIPMIELNIASILAQGAKHGDHARLNFLLDRCVGKPEVQKPLEPDNEIENAFNLNYKKI